MLNTHDLTEDELRSGSKLTDLQIKVIQNRVAHYVLEQYGVSPDAVDDYSGKFNYLRGQVAELLAMIETSNKLNQADNTQGE